MRNISGVPVARVADERFGVCALHVKSRNGTTIGHAQRTSATKARVSGSTWFKSAGVYHSGLLQWVGWCASSSGWMKAVTIVNDGPYGWRLLAYGEGRIIGQVVRRSGRWVVLQQVTEGSWRKRGSVSGKCPAWLAGGAVYLLLGPRWT
jgi:hypothetical protein